MLKVVQGNPRLLSMLAAVLACSGCKSSTPVTSASVATPTAPLVQEAINITPDYPLRVGNGERMWKLPVQGLGVASEAVTLEKMRNICGRYSDVSLEFSGENSPVKIINPSAIKGSSAEDLWRLQPRLDHRASEAILARTGQQSSVVAVRGDVIIAMRNQRDDYLAESRGYGLPNRMWGTYLVMTFERIYDIQKLPQSERHAQPVQ